MTTQPSRFRTHSRLDSLRDALADSTNTDALGYGLYLKADVSTAVAVAEAADLLYDAIDKAHERGETFPLQVSLWGARLALALTALKGKKA